MIKKNLSFLCILFCLPFLAKAQEVGNYKTAFKKQGNEVSFETTTAKVKIEFCSDGMFRVRSTWNGQFEPNENLMVIKYDWPTVKSTAEEKKDHFLLSTLQLDIKIAKAPFQISVYDKKGKLLSAEAGAASGMAKKGDTVGVVKSMQADEHFFGFGERMDFLDRRHKKVRLDVGRGKGLPHAIGAYNILEANYSPVPFFMSTRGYGIFLHNSFATNWDMGATHKDQYRFEAVDGEMDYYFFYGPDFPTLLNHYTELTGKSPMLPDFALGLHVGTYAGGTWGHEDETSGEYVVALAKRYREMGIPADLLWIDSTWRLFGENGGKGATSFEWRETFTNPKSMFDSIYAMDYKMVGLHVRPRFDNAKKLNLLDQAREKGFTYPEDGKPGEFVNFFDEKATDWWWKNGVMRVAAIGAKFLKTDEGSAFGALANESDKVGPTGKEAERLHNLFPLAYAKAPFEKFQQLNNMRGLNQTREGYAGIQRYPYLFAGDWPSEWQYFAPVIKAGLNIGLSGIGSWAHCMGGFEHIADPELFIRWVQFGMFSPIAMVFGMDHPGYKEPWNYGNDALRNFKNYDVLRYRMIPYLYTEMYEQHTTGKPLMRALVLDNQDDENTYEIADQYMLGKQLLVCPVTTKGGITRSVYLPKGNWYNYWTGEKHSGEQFVHVVAPLDTIPLFVKGGGIIPMQPQMAYSGEKPVDVITLAIYPDKRSEYNLYEDDGSTLAYQKGKFAQTKITADLQSNGFNLTIAKPVGDFKPSKHSYLAKINWHGKKPNVVQENGKPLKEAPAVLDGKQAGWHYDAKTKLLWVSSQHSNIANIDLIVK
jgi:alpha-glucosidase